MQMAWMLKKCAVVRRSDHADSLKGRRISQMSNRGEDKSASSAVMVRLRDSTHGLTEDVMAVA